jgi:hypothetical protein
MTSTYSKVCWKNITLEKKMQCLDWGFELPSWETHVYTCLAQLFSAFARIISLCNCLVQCNLCNFHGHNFFHLLAPFLFFDYCMLTSFWAKHFLSKEKPNSIILQLATIDKIVFNTNNFFVFYVTCLMQLYTCHMQLKIISCNNF